MSGGACGFSVLSGTRPEAALGLALGRVLTGLGAGAGAGAMATGAAADLSAVTPLREAAALSEVSPLLGLAALSAFGLHMVPKVSAGPQRLDQVGPETETRATVTSGSGLAGGSGRARRGARRGGGWHRAVEEVSVAPGSGGQGGKKRSTLRHRDAVWL